VTRPRLSLCIATLNRAPFLRVTLDSIVSQTREGLEIVIVDGGSTDGTRELVREYVARHDNIRYVRLDQKGGVDQDYCRAVDEASGEYCWLFTDDDILKPGAIEAVWLTLARGYSLVVVNADVRDATLTHLLAPRRLPFETDVEFGPGEFEALFMATASYMSFIGCVVIRRDLWQSRERVEYFGTVFVHVGVVFQAPLPASSLAIGHPYISIRYGNALWTSKSFEISMFKWPQLIWSFTNVSHAARQAVSPPEPWRTWTALLVYRARGAYVLADYRRLLQARMTSRTARAWAQIVAALPACAVNLVLVAYLSVIGRRRSDRALRLVDLRASSSYYRRCLSRLLARVRPAAAHASTSASS